DVRRCTVSVKLDSSLAEIRTTLGLSRRSIMMGFRCFTTSSHSLSKLAERVANVTFLDIRSQLRGHRRYYKWFRRLSRHSCFATKRHKKHKILPRVLHLCGKPFNIGEIQLRRFTNAISGNHDSAHAGGFDAAWGGGIKNAGCR